MRFFESLTCALWCWKKGGRLPKTGMGQAVGCTMLVLFLTLLLCYALPFFKVYRLTDYAFDRFLPSFSISNEGFMIEKPIRYETDHLFLLLDHTADKSTLNKTLDTKTTYAIFDKNGIFLHHQDQDLFYSYADLGDFSLSKDGLFNFGAILGWVMAILALVFYFFFVAFFAFKCLFVSLFGLLITRKAALSFKNTYKLCLYAGLLPTIVSTVLSVFMISVPFPVTAVLWLALLYIFVKSIPKASKVAPPPPEIYL